MQTKQLHNIHKTINDNHMRSAQDGLTGEHMVELEGRTLSLLNEPDIPSISMDLKTIRDGHSHLHFGSHMHDTDGKGHPGDAPVFLHL